MAINTRQQSTIPTIDLAPARSSFEDRVKTAKELCEAFKAVSFAYVKNHGVPEETLNEAFQWNRKFFDLPQSEKEKAKRPPERWCARGYSHVGREKVSQMIFDEASLAEARKVPDVKESFDMGSDRDESLSNVWMPPDVLPGFREFCMEFYEICNEVELELIRLIALGMGMDEEYFVEYRQNKENHCRLVHYPAIQEESLRQKKVERIGAHSDFGTITMLFQDDVGGLEVEDPREKDKFNPVPYIPGTAVVNVGDFLMRWSNDEFKSAVHRVGAPPLSQEQEGYAGLERRVTRARYSVVHFMFADREKMIDCVPGCWGPDKPKKYEPITAGEYLDKRNGALF